jgi:hypothetical protein
LQALHGVGFPLKVFLVALPRVRDLLRAKHLFVVAMVAGCGMTWLNEDYSAGGYAQDTQFGISVTLAGTDGTDLSERAPFEFDASEPNVFNDATYLNLVAFIPGNNCAIGATRQVAVDRTKIDAGRFTDHVLRYT